MIGDDLVAEIASREPPTPVVSIPKPLTAAEIYRTQSTKPSKTDPMAVAKNAIDLAGNPDRLMEVIRASGSEIDDVAPETAQDVRDTTARAIFFLASKAPKERLSSPGMPPLPPIKQDVLRFSRYMQAVDDPMSLLDDAESGTLAPESVEAVKSVYPKLFEMMQAELAMRVENMPKVPYKRRMQISALLGQDMTGTINPTIGMLAQSTYGNAPQEPQGAQLKAYQGRALNADSRAARETTEWRKAQEGVGRWNRIGRRTQ